VIIKFYTKLRPSLFWNFTRRRLVFGKWRFGTNFWSHLQESSGPN